MDYVSKGTELGNTGLGHSNVEGLGEQWAVLKQIGISDEAAWDAIRNVAVIREQRRLHRINAEPEPRSDIAHYTNWRGKHRERVKAVTENIERLLALPNPYRKEVAA